MAKNSINISIDIKCGDCGERMVETRLYENDDIYKVEEILEKYMQSMDAYDQILCKSCQKEFDEREPHEWEKENMI